MYSATVSGKTTRHPHPRLSRKGRDAEDRHPSGACYCGRLRYRRNFADVGSADIKPTPFGRRAGAGGESALGRALPRTFLAVLRADGSSFPNATLGDVPIRGEEPVEVDVVPSEAAQ